MVSNDLLRQEKRANISIKIIIDADCGQPNHNNVSSLLLFLFLPCQVPSRRRRGGGGIGIIFLSLSQSLSLAPSPSFIFILAFQFPSKKHKIMGFKFYKRFSNSILLYKSSHFISSGRHPSATSSASASFLLQPPFNSHHQVNNNNSYNNPPPFIIHRRWHFGHSHAHHSDHHHRPSPGEQSESIFRLGLAADIGLAAGKAFTGYLSGSTAIIADAAHSVSDVVLSGIALWSFKAGMAPKDKEHPYGHFF